MRSPFHAAVHAFRSPAPLAQTLRFVPPDFSQRRGDRHLLIWKEIPFWTVVDSEFLEFVQGLDGSRSLREWIRFRPGWMKLQDDIASQINILRRWGVVVGENGPARTPAAKRQSKPRIENVAINVTRRCNLRCRFCFDLDSPARCREADEEIGAEEIVEFLERIRPLLSKRCSLTLLGGEPLLRPEVVLEIAGFGKRRGLTTLVSTNGLKVTDSFARSAARVGLQVQVSIDGPTPAIHEAIRGKGSFHRAVAGVRTLVDRGVHAILSMVCCQDNLAALEAYYRFAQDLGAAEARFIPLKRMGGGASNGVRPASLRRMVRLAADMFEKSPASRALAGTDALSVMVESCRYSSRRQSCGTGLQTFLLDSDGSLYPCLNCNRPEFRFGNFRDPDFDFSGRWRTSPVLARHRRLCSVEAMADKCRDCPVHSWCLAGCRGETYANSGRLDAPAVDCGDLRAAYLEALWTIADKPGLTKPPDRRGFVRPIFD